MNKTRQGLLVDRPAPPLEQDLFEDNGPYQYHVVASNRADEDVAATMEWYCKRGDASASRIKDLKTGS